MVLNWLEPDELDAGEVTNHSNVLPHWFKPGHPLYQWVLDNQTEPSEETVSDALTEVVSSMGEDPDKYEVR